MSEHPTLEDWRAKTWETARGIETTVYDNHVILARASIEEVGQALLAHYPQARWSRDVLGREIVLGQEGFFIFRLRGHAWTQLLHHGGLRSVLQKGYIERLSRDLNARVINYFVAYVLGVVGYSLYEQGEEVATFDCTEWGDVEFSSPQLQPTAQEIGSVRQFAHQLFVEQDALEPGIQFGYFLNGYDAAQPKVRPGRKVKVHNPGLMLGSGRQTAVSRPAIERVDYLALVA